MRQLMPTWSKKRNVEDLLLGRFLKAQTAGLSLVVCAMEKGSAFLLDVHRCQTGPHNFRYGIVAPHYLA